MMMCCGRAVKTVGMLRVSVGKMKALTVRVETVTVIGKGGEDEGIDCEGGDSDSDW